MNIKVTRIIRILFEDGYRMEAETTLSPREVKDELKQKLEDDVNKVEFPESGENEVKILAKSVLKLFLADWILFLP